MTKGEVITIIENVAKAHGYTFSTENWLEMKDERISNWNDSWVGFTVSDMENADYDFDNKKITAEFKIVARVRRMGGETNPDELFEASTQIARAACLVEQLEKMDLTYTKQY